MKPKPPSRPRRDPAPLPVACEALLTPDQVARALGTTTRSLRGMLSAGEFPPHDLLVNKSKRWRVSTFNTWVESRCKGA